MKAFKTLLFFAFFAIAQRSVVHAQENLAEKILRTGSQQATPLTEEQTLALQKISALAKEVEHLFTHPTSEFHEIQFSELSHPESFVSEPEVPQSIKNFLPFYLRRAPNPQLATSNSDYAQAIRELIEQISELQDSDYDFQIGRENFLSLDPLTKEKVGPSFFETEYFPSLIGIRPYTHDVIDSYPLDEKRTLLDPELISNYMKYGGRDFNVEFEKELLQITLGYPANHLLSFQSYLEISKIFPKDSALALRTEFLTLAHEKRKQMGRLSLDYQVLAEIVRNDDAVHEALRNYILELSKVPSVMGGVLSFDTSLQLIFSDFPLSEFLKNSPRKLDSILREFASFRANPTLLLLKARDRVFADAVQHLDSIRKDQNLIQSYRDLQLKKYDQILAQYPQGSPAIAAVNRERALFLAMFSAKNSDGATLKGTFECSWILGGKSARIEHSIQNGRIGPILLHQN